tara:strand:+ start:312 stop:653 length:342 start_codon:yes stop_codon:yes gene_type:complete
MNKYNEDTFKKEERDQADVLGWMLMGTGISEITEKTISELLFRVRFMDFSYGHPYFNSDPSDEQITTLFRAHLGLKIEITNRGIKNLNTRRRFMVNQLDNMERRIERKIDKVQ